MPRRTAASTSAFWNKDKETVFADFPHGFANGWRLDYWYVWDSPDSGFHHDHTKTIPYAGAVYVTALSARGRRRRSREQLHSADRRSLLHEVDAAVADALLLRRRDRLAVGKQQRWQLLQDAESAELRRTSMETKLRQLSALMASRDLFGPDPRREEQVLEVRERWARLRRALGG